MSTKRDYYEILEIEQTASSQEISTSYRKLAIKFHPDKNPGDEEAITRFKECAEAFEILNDSEKRSRYDQYGHAGVDGNSHGGFSDVNDIFEAFGDMFGGIFSGGSRRRGQRRARKGEDLRVDVDLDLIEAARGCSKEIEFKRRVQCQDCSGSGAKPGSAPETCSYCGGHGQVVQSAGILRVQTTCPSCEGRGSVISNPCKSCSGTGHGSQWVSQTVEIPAGVDSNMKVRVPGEGHPSTGGGPPGDVYCFINVQPHPLFHRDGSHLVCSVPISYSQAALGATLEIPTLDGRHELDIPQGTQSHDVFRLRGQGMPDPRGHSNNGDLLVQVELEVPKKLDAEQEKLLRELAELEHANVSPKRKSFFESLRNYFTSSNESSVDE